MTISDLSTILVQDYNIGASFILLFIMNSGGVLKACQGLPIDPPKWF